jgi:AcrR family transcriptional regulator
MTGKARRGKGQDTAVAIREAAAALFAQHGYEATSLREIASAVGIQVGSLYNHIAGKDELLSVMMIEVMDDLLSASTAAVEGVDDPLDQLVAALDCHLRFHAVRARDVFIGNSELRSLSRADRRRLMVRRDRYEELMLGLVEAVMGPVDERQPSARLQTYTVLAIGAHVPSWYRPDGPLTLDQIIHDFTEIILRQLGVPARTRARVTRQTGVSRAGSDAGSPSTSG